MTRPTLTARAVIWDYNGTILDDLGVMLESLNRLLAARKLAPVGIEEHRGSFRFPVQEYYEELGFDLAREPFSDLSREFHDHYLAMLPHCQLHAGVEELLAALSRRGIPQFVLSAMHQPWLEESAASLGIAHYFRGVYGLEDLLARSKADRGIQLLHEHGLEPGSTVFIGDTDHDVEVAHRLGCVPAVVSVGHQAPARFAGLNVAVYGSFHELHAALRDGVETPLPQSRPQPES